MNRSQALDAVKQIICNDRQDTHGNPEDTHQIIADMWNAYLGCKNLTAQDVAVMMVLFKCARHSINNKHTDNLLDAVGYAAIAIEIGDKN